MLATESRSPPPALLRLLLVEDNPGDADLLRVHVQPVRRPKLHLEHVTRLAEALERLKTDGFDGVILDLGLPDATGLESVQRLIDARPDVPIIVLTGRNDEQLGYDAVDNGAQDFFTKCDLDGQRLVNSVLFAIERLRLRDQTRRIIDRNVDAMVVVGEDGVIRHRNRAAEALSSPEIPLRVGDEFPWSLGLRSGQEIEFTRSEDDRRVAQMRVTTIDWEGSRAYLASIRDITPLKRSQDLELQLLHADRLTSIGQLAAGVAHEINNPSACIRVNLEALKAEVHRLTDLARGIRSPSESDRALVEQLAELMKDTRFEDMLAMIEECESDLSRISTIVRELRPFARSESAPRTLFDLRSVVRTACTMTHNELRHRAALDLSLNGETPVRGDRSGLTQVVVNLLINAAHAIDESNRDQAVITVTTRRSSREVVLAVEDTGCGIPERDLDRVFEPFFTTKPVEAGTGLGLSLSAEIVRRHGGRMGVTSRVGQGSRFEVALPLHQAELETEPAAAEGLTATPARGAAKKARVLVVDDEPLVRRAIQRSLSARLAVVEASTAREVLDLLDGGESFDVIICDLMMPGMDGPSLHEAVEARRPELAQRFIFLTGGVFTKKTRDFIDRTPNLVLEKPFSPARLRDEVSRIIRGETGRRGPSRR